MYIVNLLPEILYNLPLGRARAQENTTVVSNMVAFINIADKGWQ